MTMSTPSSRRGSSFSNSNLTTLQSRLLEVDLENAKHNSNKHGSTDQPIKECEMDAEDYEYLQQLLGNDCCADCSSPHTEWASVSFGILLCANCSGVHRALGTHISRVRSIKMDSWSDEHLELMRVGGNYACRRYLEQHNATANAADKDNDEDVPFDFYETPIPERYSSAVAEAYKKRLKQRAMANLGATTTPSIGGNRKGSKLDETESSTEMGESKHSKDSSSSSKHGYKANKSSPGTHHTQDEESEISFAEDNSDSLNGGKKISKEDNDDSDRAAIDEDDKEDDDSEAAQDSENEEDASSVGASAKRNSLESWFKKSEGGRRVSAVMPVPSSDFSLSGATTFTTNTIQSAFTSLTARGRRSIRRSSSSVASAASAPTITYMGRSFSADGSDDCKLHVRRERRQTDVSLLSDMADTQDKIARENLDNSWRESAWRQSAPQTLQWSADKKVEPFSSLRDNSTASYPASSTRRGGRRPSRHESLREKFAYTDADVLKITQDAKEFARLKAGLRSKGAITNEVLKQKLYAFVAKSKLRNSETAESMKANASSIAGEEEKRRSKTRSKRRSKLQASKSEDLTLLRSAIQTNTASY